MIKMLIDSDLDHFKTHINQFFSDLQINYESIRETYIYKTSKIRCRSYEIENTIFRWF